MKYGVARFFTVYDQLWGYILLDILIYLGMPWVPNGSLFPTIIKLMGLLFGLL